MKNLLKKHLRLLFFSCGIGFCFLITYSCTTIIEENPESIIVAETFFKTEEDIVSAANGVYNTLRHGSLFRQEAYYFTHIGTDVANVNPAERNDFAQEISKYTLNANTSRLEGVWNALYQGISRANTVIDNVGGVEGVDEAIKSRALGEVKFLRAFYYFMLTNVWGDVPLITSQVTDVAQLDDVTRTSKEAVYNAIIQDLTDANSNLPAAYSGGDIGRATSGAASALLAKLYLFKQDWTNASTKLREVITSNEYSLMSSYEELFYSRNDNGPESIFEVQFVLIPGAAWSDTWQAYNITPTFGSSEVPGGADVKGGGWASVVPTQEFFDSFDASDVRRDVNLYTEWTDDGGVTTTFTQPYINKYNDERSLPFSGPADGELNFKILRYADVLLMLAEAINEQGGPTQEAYDAINMVRQRAGLPNLAGLTQGSFRDAILQERAWELAYEGHRKFDLARTGKLVDIVRGTSGSNPTGAANVQAFHGLFPIPQPIIDTSPGITQNQGY